MIDEVKESRSKPIKVNASSHNFVLVNLAKFFLGERYMLRSVMKHVLDFFLSQSSLSLDSDLTQVVFLILHFMKVSKLPTDYIFCVLESCFSRNN